MAHISNHFVTPRRVSSICRWNHCGSKTLTKAKLLEHLTAAHGIPLRHDSMKQAGFCYECSEFFIHEDVWEDHCASHVSDPELFCGQIVCRGIIVFARKCMFCLADANLTAAERYHSFTHAPHFFRHLQTHLRSLFVWPTSCPHPKCSAEIASEAAFWFHLRAAHGVARYKPESSFREDVAVATILEANGISEAEMTDVDTSNVVTTDPDSDDDEDDGDGDDDIAEICETSRPLRGEHMMQPWTADLAVSSARTRQPVDAALKPEVLQGSSQDMASFCHAGADHAMGQEDLPAQTREPETGGSTFATACEDREEGEDSEGRDCCPESTVLTLSSDQNLPDVCELQRPQHEQADGACTRDKLCARSLTAERLPPIPENCSFVAASTPEAFELDLVMSGMKGDFDRDGRGPTASIEKNNSSVSPDVAPVPGVVTSRVLGKVQITTFPTGHGAEQYSHLRPIPSQAGRACDAPGCTEVFRFVRDLNYHLIRAHNRSHHTCRVSGCGKMCRDATRLREHERTHSGEKVLTCSFEHCGRTFARPHALLCHRRNVHEMEKSFVCGVIKDSRACKSAFDASWKLKRHKRGVHRCA